MIAAHSWSLLVFLHVAVAPAQVTIQRPMLFRSLSCRLHRGPPLVPNPNRHHCCPSPQGLGPHWGTHRPACKWVPSHLHPLCTPRASPFTHQRFLWCIRGSNSSWSEFVCGHGGCLVTKRGSTQHRHHPKRTSISNMSSVQHADPGCSK